MLLPRQPESTFVNINQHIPRSRPPGRQQGHGAGSDGQHGHSEDLKARQARILDCGGRTSADRADGQLLLATPGAPRGSTTPSRWTAPPPLTRQCLVSEVGIGSILCIAGPKQVAQRCGSISRGGRIDGWCHLVLSQTRGSTPRRLHHPSPLAFRPGSVLYWQLPAAGRPVLRDC